MSRSLFRTDFVTYLPREGLQLSIRSKKGKVHGTYTSIGIVTDWSDCSLTSLPLKGDVPNVLLFQCFYSRFYVCERDFFNLGSQCLTRYNEGNLFFHHFSHVQLWTSSMLSPEIRDTTGTSLRFLRQRDKRRVIKFTQNLRRLVRPIDTGTHLYSWSKISAFNFPKLNN